MRRIFFYISLAMAGLFFGCYMTFVKCKQFGSKKNIKRLKRRTAVRIKRLINA